MSITTSTPTRMRRFELHRDEDVSGVSGTGRVAEGVEFTNSFCALNWLSPYHTTAIYSSASELEHIHSHGGRTRLVWLDPALDPAPEGDVAPDLGRAWAPQASNTPLVSARVLINSGTITAHSGRAGADVESSEPPEPCMEHLDVPVAIGENPLTYRWEGWELHYLRIFRRWTTKRVSPIVRVCFARIPVLEPVYGTDAVVAVLSPAPALQYPQARLDTQKAMMIDAGVPMPKELIAALIVLANHAIQAWQGSMEEEETP